MRRLAREAAVGGNTVRPDTVRLSRSVCRSERAGRAQIFGTLVLKIAIAVGEDAVVGVVVDRLVAVVEMQFRAAEHGRRHLEGG